MNQKPVSEILEELPSSYCKKSKCRNKLYKCKAVELLCTDLCGCFKCENYGLGEDDDELSDQNEDREIIDDDDGESEFDDDRELSVIDNSDEEEYCSEQRDLTELVQSGCTDISFLFLIN